MNFRVESRIIAERIRFTATLKGGSDVARRLRQHPEKVGRTLLSLVNQEAGGLAVELARNIRPHGFSEAARKRGEMAVAGDIGLAFALSSDAFEKPRPADPAAADRFWANIQNRPVCPGAAITAGVSVAVEGSAGGATRSESPPPKPEHPRRGDSADSRLGRDQPEGA
jgi:hypothetical protein